ncbi:G-protein coupled receptor [Metarhizium album ARSEF 1941]|uniref:G-protein coupled receptor n=1 Tax=Metarhizium album (strain ARSEF 1941) TaxID=1081103 RepID=A0A0B2WZF7_METAS|nr:G-protein coupled receptor [Metarhizium album ARSEF 1941]KHN98964.1 G-protein coupled receptor [Metarhizium album ARSEF 1941]
MESSDDGSTLSTDHINTLITIERTGAGLSMAAILLTVVSFVAFKKLRTTPNTFLVFASVANAGASVASMIGYDGLRMGEESTLCQAQGFIFEWFMQADPWWSFAMALNVFLVFFNNASPKNFQKYTWAYCVVCFGGPMLPAVVLVSIRDQERGPIFGDAALWCWIRPQWSTVRLYAYYIPIWICILLSILIYIAVGYHVFRSRNQLRNVTFQHPAGNFRSASLTDSDNGSSGEENPARQTGCYGVAVTEVQVTTNFSGFADDDIPALPAAVHRTPSRICGGSWLDPPNDSDSERVVPTQQFETTCSAGKRHTNSTSLASKFGALTSTASMKLKRLDSVKMAYLRTSFIFGLSVLITWIPSSINRLYSLKNGGQVSYTLSIASGCVLPLQGVWNAIIFFTTSWSEVQAETKAVKAKFGYGSVASMPGD